MYLIHRSNHHVKDQISHQSGHRSRRDSVSPPDGCVCSLGPSRSLARRLRVHATISVHGSDCLELGSVNVASHAALASPDRAPLPWSHAQHALMVYGVRCSIRYKVETDVYVTTPSRHAPVEVPARACEDGPVHIYVRTLRLAHPRHACVKRSNTDESRREQQCIVKKPIEHCPSSGQCAIAMRTSKYCVTPRLPWAALHFATP